MSEGFDLKERDSTKSKRDYFLSSIRETDEKIKNLFQDILDERKNTQKFLKDNIDRAVTPTGDTQQNISFNSGKGDSRRGSYRNNKENISANTSALLDEEGERLEDTFTVLNTTNKKPTNNSEKKAQNIHIQGDYATMDNLQSDFDISGLGSPIDPAKIIGSLRKENRENKYDDYRKNSTYKNKYEDDLGSTSGNRLLDTLKSDDFALTGGEILQKKPSLPTGPIYQVSKQEINFGILFPTEIRSESFEIFNKTNKDLEFEAAVLSENSNVSYSLSIDKEQHAGKQRITFKVNKFTFQTINVQIQTGFYGNETGSFKATVKVRSEDKESSVNLKSEIEKPMLQLMNSYVERLVGQVPFIQFDTNSSSDPKMPFSFKNNGKRAIQLEFELIQDPKLAEVLFSPKYLSIGEGEEKTVVIRMVSQFEDRDKKRAIVKYRIRGTSLSQCLVLNFV